MQFSYRSNGDSLELCYDLIYCCSELQQAVLDGFVDFGEWNDAPNKLAAMCIYQGYPGDRKDEMIEDAMPIKCCPFCGERFLVYAGPDASASTH